jgi:hypothetical protein
MGCYYRKHHQNSTTTILILPKFRKCSRSGFQRSWYRRRMSSLCPICIYLITFIVLPAHSWLMLFPSPSFVNSRDPFLYRKSRTTTRRRWLQNDDSNDKDGIDTSPESGDGNEATDKNNMTDRFKYKVRTTK